MKKNNNRDKMKNRLEIKRGQSRSKTKECKRQKIDEVRQKVSKNKLEIKRETISEDK